MKVSWDDHSQYIMEKNVWNHQPDNTTSKLACSPNRINTKSSLWELSIIVPMLRCSVVKHHHWSSGIIIIPGIEKQNNKTMYLTVPIAWMLWHELTPFHLLILISLREMCWRLSLGPETEKVRKLNIWATNSKLRRNPDGRRISDTQNQ